MNTVKEGGGGFLDMWWSHPNLVGPRDINRYWPRELWEELIQAVRTVNPRVGATQWINGSQHIAGSVPLERRRVAHPIHQTVQPPGLIVPVVCDRARRVGKGQYPRIGVEPVKRLHIDHLKFIPEP